MNQICSGKRFHLCRRLVVLDGMGGCLTVISFLMISHIISFVVLCTGSQSIIHIWLNFQLSVWQIWNYVTILCFCSDGLDEYAVNRFLCQVFSCDDFPGKVCSLVKESLSRKFDMKEEVSHFSALVLAYFLFIVSICLIQFCLLMFGALLAA